MQVPDFITQWVDGRIKVGMSAMVAALIANEDDLLNKLGDRVVAGLRDEFGGLMQAVTAIPKAVQGLLVTELDALPSQVGEIESAGLQGLEAIPQQVAAQIQNLPAEVAQAISGLFPHFLRHLADLPPGERDKLLAQAARRAVESPDDLARRLLQEHREE